ncbi:MAG: 6-phosphofructokinase [Christensenellales bacterium]|jgi:6-phosphofructokinase
MRRIGMLTSGGDCQGLNAALRGVAKALYECCEDIEIYGILDGYKGLIHGDYRLMNPWDFSGILTIGGTILGASRQPFKSICRRDDNCIDKVAEMKKHYEAMGLESLVVIGGNGTHKTANLLSQEGLNIVSLPKTIDNDIWGTDMTFGFQSAVDIATNVIDCIHTTATSHGRVFIIELMGHKAGWLALHAGLAGGADIILLPEIPYHVDSVVHTLQRRIAGGKRFSIIAMAEGALSLDESKLEKKAFKERRKKEDYASIAYRLADEITERIDVDIRVTVPGHYQRGGPPCPYDRVLSTRFGTAAADLISRRDYGKMVALIDNRITAVPHSEVAGRLKLVPKDCEIVSCARKLGVDFGD